MKIRRTPSLRTRQNAKRIPGDRHYPTTFDPVTHDRLVNYGNARTVVEVRYAGTMNVPVDAVCLRRNWGDPRQEERR